MSDYIKRIENEKIELDYKLDALCVFINTDTFDKLESEHQKLLLAQQGTMARYSRILEDRLNLIKGEK